MRTIRRTNQFKKDYRCEILDGGKLDELLASAVERLAENLPLPPHYLDHKLPGKWKDHLDCHIRPDLVLIYRKPDKNSLELVRLGSHSELFA
jgi:mRNA interferase YafQ